MTRTLVRFLPLLAIVLSLAAFAQTGTPAPAAAAPACATGPRSGEDWHREYPGGHREHQ